MRKKRNGFTLIELLAVIVILAVIALITVPIIMNIIDDAKLGAFKSSVNGIFETANLYIVGDDVYEKFADGLSHEIDLESLNYKGQRLTGKLIVSENGSKIEAVNISNGTYCANGVLGSFVVTKGTCVEITSTLMKTNIDENVDYFFIPDLQKEKIKSVEFIRTDNVPTENSIDVSENQDGSIKLWYETIDAQYIIHIASKNKILANPISAGLFIDLINADSINLGNFDTSNVTNMQDMFKSAGYYNSNFTLNLGNNFYTSNVTMMGTMFQFTGYSSENFTLNLGDKFDTSNVTYMSYMFAGTGYNSTKFTLNLGDKFDTSNVRFMEEMFAETGYSSPLFQLNLGDKFDTRNVIYMNGIFKETGYSSLIFKLSLGDKFDTSNVERINQMFDNTGYSSPVFELNLGNKFFTNKIDNFDQMFNFCGYANPNFKLDLSTLDFSNGRSLRFMLMGYRGTNELIIKNQQAKDFLLLEFPNLTNIIIKNP